MTDKIVIKNLQVSFGAKVVLQDIDLVVKIQDSVVIVGESGSGKSVLLKSIVGLIKANKGMIKINDREMACSVEKNAQVNSLGMIFQRNALFDGLYVWQNIVFGFTKIKTREFAGQFLNLVALPRDILDKYPADLSGGMQKRVAIARALAHEPKIILCDEPTSGLDPITAQVIDDVIIRCNKELGSTIITVTHNVKSALRISNKIAVLRNGKIIWYGNTSEITKSNDPYLQKFFYV